MAKYTKQELQDMAIRVKKAEKESDPRYLQIVMLCAVAYGDEPFEVMAKIDRMAEGDFDGIDYK